MMQQRELRRLPRLSYEQYSSLPADLRRTYDEIMSRVARIESEAAMVLGDLQRVYGSLAHVVCFCLFRFIGFYGIAACGGASD